MENIKQKPKNTDNSIPNSKTKIELDSINNSDIFSNYSQESKNKVNTIDTFNENNKNFQREIIKFTKNSKSFEKSDLMSRLSIILEHQNITQIEKNRTKNIFKNFIDYSNNNKSINNRKNSIIANKILYTKRIKLSDINKFIDYKYKKSTDLTIHNMKIRMRKYVRLLNNEPKLNFRNKINKISSKNHPKLNMSKDIIIIIKYLANKSNLLNILLFYFLYFVGLNYSLLSRIMIQNFKRDFDVLIIKKEQKRKFK